MRVFEGAAEQLLELAVKGCYVTASFPTGFSGRTGRQPEGGGLFHLWIFSLRRVIAYVDGFNLYHAIDELRKPHLKWVDLFALAESLCGSNESLVGVSYFSAYANWLPEETRRHREYVRALEHAGVLAFMGHFKEKRRACRACGAQWTGHEEKESDVALAVALVADGFQDRFDRALVITADSDIAPAIRIVREAFPAKSLDVVAPPGRYSYARSLAPKLAITPGRLAKCLLPESASNAEGGILYRRPRAYAPPAG
jgi:hypothetical protein